MLHVPRKPFNQGVNHEAALMQLCSRRKTVNWAPYLWVVSFHIGRHEMNQTGEKLFACTKCDIEFSHTYSKGPKM